MKPARLLLPLLIGSTVGAHAAPDAELLRCRAVADAGARLACYDAIVAAPPSTAAAAAVPAAAFGFEERAVVEGPRTIESRIEGRFQGWRPRTEIRLANGQVWQVIDDSRGLMDLLDPKVTVTRGTFGTFFMQFESRNQAPRVKRVE